MSPQPHVIHDLSGIKKSEYLIAARLESEQPTTTCDGPRHMNNGESDP